MANPPALIAVDWGTSALRGALLAADGTALAEHAAPLGLLSVAPGSWAQVFHAQFGAWRRAHPGLLCLLAGMVGSRQGWAEAPYCPCPAGLDDVARQLLWVLPGEVAIVPGISSDAAGLPDVMRGEETQVFGALQWPGLAPQRDALLVLPGTHSKWVQVRAGRITGLATHMTGECYALLRQQSILARLLPADAGVQQAVTPGGLLHHLFSVRTLGLFGRADGPALASRLSGLLIGEELRAQAIAPGAAVWVLGSAALAARYERALALCGHAAHRVPDSATWLVMLAVAGAAGLLHSPGTGA